MAWNPVEKEAPDSTSTGTVYSYVSTFGGFAYGGCRGDQIVVSYNWGQEAKPVSSWSSTARPASSWSQDQKVSSTWDAQSKPSSTWSELEKP